jgi:tRNA-Thr(GGU) m(6)t(6)A37 methyltransferase TsaA
VTGPAPLREHEVATDAAPRADASIAFLGRIRTPWPDRAACPHQGDPEAGPECRIEIDPPWDAALEGIERRERIVVLYWLDQSRRELRRQNPNRGSGPKGTFALRSPLRPNPIGVSTVALLRREGNVLVVRGLDCVDCTPVIDLKPEICAWSPPAAAPDV